MMAMDLEASTAIILVVGVFGVNLIGELVKLFFKRLRSTDFVTRTYCGECKSDATVIKTEDRKKIDAMARLVLAMAIKMGIDTKEIQELLR